MKKRSDRVSDVVREVQIGMMICTRLPLGSATQIASNDLVRASWALPVAGAFVGVVATVAFWLATAVGLPPTLAAALALTATLLVTGGLHEDGLADTADGFGGGWNETRKLEIMRDSRIGSYGACALVMSLILRWAALSAFAGPASAALALIAAHTAARAALPAFMHVVPPARNDGLSAETGAPAVQSIAVAALIGVVVLTLTLGFAAMIIAQLLVTTTGVVFALLCMRQIGGQTGDVLGALEQVVEIVVLLTAVALS